MLFLEVICFLDIVVQGVQLLWCLFQLVVFLYFLFVLFYFKLLFRDHFFYLQKFFFVLQVDQMFFC
ncbi:TPA: hypothetical protein DIC40_04590 [Patescibacteria group bacterium]|nr:hypothetical protein [Candidatus Gracilibacteria bacterium]